MYGNRLRISQADDHEHPTKNRTAKEHSKKHTAEVKQKNSKKVLLQINVPANHSLPRVSPLSHSSTPQGTPYATTNTQIRCTPVFFILILIFFRRRRRSPSPLFQSVTQIISRLRLHHHGAEGMTEVCVVALFPSSSSVVVVACSGIVCACLSLWLVVCGSLMDRSRTTKFPLCSTLLP